MIEDLKVWGFMLLTILVKLLLSPSQSIVRACATVSSGVLAALVMTDPTLDILGRFWNLDADAYLVMVVCFWALAGENFLRRVLDILENDDLLMAIIDRWRGK